MTPYLAHSETGYRRTVEPWSSWRKRDKKVKVSVKSKGDSDAGVYVCLGECEVAKDGERR